MRVVEILRCTQMPDLPPVDLLKRFIVQFFSELFNEWCDCTNKSLPIQVRHWHVNRSTEAPHFCWMYREDRRKDPKLWGHLVPKAKSFPKKEYELHCHDLGSTCEP
uniref:Uncharacterized protein n=1 Tax=Opuntia streptacantha TaxID=393608 RepID=A0A7C9F2N8_OPUST